METYTYSNGELLPGDSTGLVPKKNCRVKINLPGDADTEQISAMIESINLKDSSDIMLYGAASFTESEEDSKLFPSADYSILVIPAPLNVKVSNVDRSAFNVYGDHLRSVFILSNNSIIRDNTTGILIVRTADGIILTDSAIRSIETHTDKLTGQDWIFEL